MRSTAGAARAENALVRLCHSGLGVSELQPRVLSSLRTLMPVDAAFFPTADPETLLLTGAYVEEPLGASTPLFLANEFGVPDVNKFASLATAPTHVATLDQATRHDRTVSSRATEIMAPLGLGDELRAALVVGADCWGYLCLHRSDHPLGFTADEVALVARLSPHIAHALRQGLLLNGSARPGGAPAPGVVLLADDLSTVAITDEAQDLLSQIDPNRPTAGRLPVAVYTVAAALTAIENGTAAAHAQPSARVRTVSGRWLRVHASRLHGSPGDARITVIVESIDARLTAPLLLAAHGLTPRETQVATLVLRGEPTSSIADALHISRHTVQDHLKVVFDKMGVHSRRDLVGRLLGATDPTPPR